MRLVQSLLGSFLFVGLAFFACRAVEQTVRMAAIDLLCPDRSDLLAKIPYVRRNLFKLQTDFPVKLYLNHLWAWNKFFVAIPKRRNPLFGLCKQHIVKNTPGEWLYHFDQVIHSLRDGFDDNKSLIPIARDGVLLDAAHRVSTAIVMGLQLPVITVDKPKGVYMSLQELRKRGLAEVYLDAMACEYLPLKNNWCLVIFPPNVLRHKIGINRLIRSIGRVVYIKSFILNQRIERFLSAALDGDFEYLIQSETTTVTDKRYMTACLCEEDDVELGKKIDFLAATKDTLGVYKKTPRIQACAQMLFNNNSLELLDASRLGKKSNFQALFVTFLEKFEQLTDTERNAVCLAGDCEAVIRGIKDCRAIEFICNEKLCDKKKLINGETIICVNNLTDAIDSIIFDPMNYFYWCGVKCTMGNIK